METSVQAMFNQAQRIVFLTGAGVSTPSGIPDYRSKNGLYTGHKNAEYYLSHDYLINDEMGFYHYVKDNLFYPAAQPNVIHQKMAQLTQQKRAAVITQNIDNLYDVANTQQLVEFHGNLYRIYCQKCGKTVDWQTYLKNPVHENCGGFLRSDCVLYGEAIKTSVVEQAVEYMQQADLVVICGTSMRVYPFAGLLDYRQPSATVLAINAEPLQLPIKFKMVQTDAVEFFQELVV